jgi:hypothetical protein
VVLCDYEFARPDIIDTTGGWNAIFEEHSSVNLVWMSQDLQTQIVSLISLFSDLHSIMIPLSLSQLQFSRRSSEGWACTITRASSFAHDFSREGRILTTVEECADGNLCNSMNTELKDVFICETQQSLVVAIASVGYTVEVEFLRLTPCYPHTCCPCQSSF